MNKRMLFFFIVYVTGLTSIAQPVSLHPKNTHYLICHGQPLVLITSAEHYGAVLNTDFDFERYLQPYTMMA